MRLEGGVNFMKKLILAVLTLMLSNINAADLVVHEWGSINVVTGPGKTTVGNISDDQSDLPNFDHGCFPSDDCCSAGR